MNAILARRILPLLLAVPLGCVAKLETTAPPVAASISLALSAPTLTVRVGQTSAILQIALTRNAAATQAVSLSISGLPAGIRPTITPTTMVGNDRLATLELLATATATPTVATVTIRAETGVLVVLAPITLTVTP